MWCLIKPNPAHPSPHKHTHTNKKDTVHLMIFAHPTSSPHKFFIQFPSRRMQKFSYHSSHTLGVNSLLHWIFPGRYSLFVYRIYEGIQPHYFLISWDSLVRFLLQRHGLVTWCFGAKVSLIGGIWTEIYVNIMVIFFESVYVVGVGNEFEQILCHVKPFVSQ